MSPLVAAIHALAARCTTIDTGTMRIDVEQVADGIQLSLRPAAMAAGFSDGPRVSLSLSPPHARELARLLSAHAEGGVQ